MKRSNHRKHHIWKKHGLSSQKLDVRCNIISSLATRFQLIFHRKTWTPLPGIPRESPYELHEMPGPGSVMCPPLIRTWTKRVKVLGFWADPGWWVGWDIGRWVTFALQISWWLFFFGGDFFGGSQVSPYYISLLLLLLHYYCYYRYYLFIFLCMYCLFIYLFIYLIIYVFVIWVFNLFFWLWCGCHPPKCNSVVFRTSGGSEAERMTSFQEVDS